MGIIQIFYIFYEGFMGYSLTSHPSLLAPCPFTYSYSRR